MAVKRPMTPSERRTTELNRAAYEALYRYQWPTELRGSTPFPCPGQHACNALDACQGGTCSAGHRIWHTNHKM